MVGIHVHDRAARKFISTMKTYDFQIHYRTNSCLRHSERPGVDIICLPGDTSVEINVRRMPRVEGGKAYNEASSARIAGTPRVMNNKKIISISHKEKNSKVHSTFKRSKVSEARTEVWLAVSVFYMSEVRTCTERLESSPCKLPSSDVPRRAERPEYIKETHSGNHSGTRCATHHVSSLVYLVYLGIRAEYCDSTARR
ncbi:hypothetical protein ALC53_00671 [Atta colombica]|uniref:Uncharacterized protein n=1 Tax=Atta colombica TaxID=520822 RepID=A0A195BVS5_9HYME|nr:hypothetical protein ALC53_00671 [Atta colombica]